MVWNTALNRPGVDTSKTQVLNAGGWSQSNLIRYRGGLPEKNGGWARLSQTKIVGTARGMHAWNDLNSIPYLAAGSEQQLALLTTAGQYDITPLRQTDNVVVNFSTVIGSPTVTIVDASVPVTLVAGDWINIPMPVSIDTIILQGQYQVQTIISATSYTITAGSNGAAGVLNAGTVPAYTFTNTSTTTKVTLANHGLTTSNIWVNQIALTADGVTLAAYSSYAINLVIDANNFNITTTAATGNGTSSENGGQVRLEYLVATGYASAILTTGFGEGLFGAGFYGQSANSSIYTIIRQWFLDNWGQDLIGNYPGSPIFVWVPPVAGGNRAIAINTTNFMSATQPPEIVNVSFVAMPEQIMVALGVDPSTGSGVQDPMLIRWSDIADFTDWVATATNQAGSFRLPNGSRIVGGVNGPNFTLIFTDVDAWVMQYIGFPLVFGFTKIENAVGLVSARCIAITANSVYWVANDGLWVYNVGNAQPVLLTVWDNMFSFGALNRVQVDKCFIHANSWFDEVTVFFPSGSGSGEVDSFIRYNWRENVSDYGPVGTLYAATCGIDSNVFGPPIVVDTNALIQQREVAYDADGQQMGEYILSGYSTIDSGYLNTVVDQIVTDFLYRGTTPTLQYWIYTIQYPNDTPLVFGPFTGSPTAAQYETINASGRLWAIKIGMSSLGCSWRWGAFRYLFAPNGSL